MKSTKGEFFAVDDYGMGGIWFIIWAVSVDQIKTKYPFLQVFSTRPAWMTDEIYSQISLNHTVDIDEEPTGYLRRELDRSTGSM